MSYALGWHSIKPFRSELTLNSIPVSIVVASRNEENTIAQLLESLVKQSYLKNHTEIIIVDDHSEDQTIEVIQQYIGNYKYIKLFKLPKSKYGKKAALDLAIQKTNNDLILTADADCSMSENWIKTFVDYYAMCKSKLIVGPVVFKHKNIFHKLQALEFMSLVGSGAGSIGINRAIMNNGANLFFEKSLYNESNQYKEIASGDDIFLLLHAKKKYQNTIKFLKSIDALVYTQPANSLTQFFNQRIRWTSKSKAYKDSDIIITSLIVTFTNLVLAITLIYSLFNTSFFIVYLLLFFVKSMIDLTILYPASRFFKQHKLLWFFAPLQIFYPFYIIITVLFGLIGNFRWKNRSFK
jgi:glycosyltransferase involved in cell wall biosynthesis